MRAFAHVFASLDEEAFLESEEEGSMAWRIRIRITVAFVPLVLLACSGTSSPTAGGPATSKPTTVSTVSMAPLTTRPTPSSTDIVHISSTIPPSACNQDDVTHIVERFIVAFNQGDQAQLARFFGPRFQTYSVGDGDPQHGGQSFIAYGPEQRGSIVARENVTAVPRDDLLQYFATRHRHGEQLSLRRFGGQYEATLNTSNITFQLVRTADDLPPGFGGPEHLAYGKGAIDCTDQTIMAWTMSEGTGNPNDPPMGNT